MFDGPVGSDTKDPNTTSLIRGKKANSMQHKSVVVKQSHTSQTHLASQADNTHTPTGREVSMKTNFGYEILDNHIIALISIVFACLCGRNISTAELARFASRCRTDPLFPLLTMLLGAALHKYISGAGSLLTSLGLGPQYILLEDYDGLTRKVPMDICAHFDIFERSLGYGLSTALSSKKSKSCLEAVWAHDKALGKYDKRYTLNKHNWQTFGPKPGQRIVIRFLAIGEAEVCACNTGREVLYEDNEYVW